LIKQTSSNNQKIAGNWYLKKLTLTQNSKLITQNLTTDWHCHILPGLDDGAATMDEAVAMALALRQAGYSTVYCTPHMVKGTFEVDNTTVRTTLTSLQAELSRRQIELQLFPGREYYLDEFFADHLKDPLLLGETQLLLVEISNYLPVEFVKETCYRIKSAGYIPLIAHPERCRLFELPPPPRKGLRSLFSIINSKLKTQNSLGPQSGSKLEEVSLLTYLKEIGCNFQGNLGSFAGFYGERVRRQAEQFRAAGLYTHYGSDLHSARQKDILLAAGCWPLAAG
jgi:protein-tyrosine phosphatase